MSEVKTDSKNLISHMYKTSQFADNPSHINSLPKVKVSRDNSGRLTVEFPYNPALIAKIKTIEGYRWHPDMRYWSFQNSDRILNKILEVFGKESVNIDITQPANLLTILDKLCKAVQTRHYSRKTEQTYVNWVKRFICFNSNKDLLEMGEKEINAFLSHLAVNEHVSASTQTQALCAIVFLYRHVMNKDIGLMEGLIRAKKPKDYLLF